MKPLSDLFASSSCFRHRLGQDSTAKGNAELRSTKVQWAAVPGGHGFRLVGVHQVSFTDSRTRARILRVGGAHFRKLTNR